MRAHLFVVAIAALSLAGAASAEQPRAPAAPARDAGQSDEQPAAVMVAATDPLGRPSVEEQEPQQQQQQPAAKPVRHARVTTCRCGDENPSN